MKRQRIAGAIAALVLTLSLAGAAMAVDPPPGNETTVQVEITAADEFSVEITSALSDFGTVPFSLGWQACNWGCMAYYDYKVIDERGTGAGWTVQASATSFKGGPNNAFVPGSALFRSNEAYWNPTGFQAIGPIDVNGDNNAISTGVSVGAQDLPSDTIIGQSATIITGTPGVDLMTQQPNATGWFTAKESLWFTFPYSVAVGTYTSTLTLTLTSGLLP